MHFAHKEFVIDITGVLLADGQSCRMGYDKASIEVNGKSPFSRSLELLLKHFQAVIIAGNRLDLANRATCR